MPNGMKIANKTVLITGANRGIGRALVNEALKRGAKRVYAASRVPQQFADNRVTPLTLDVTDSLQIQRAIDQVADLDVLISGKAQRPPVGKAALKDKVARSGRIDDRALLVYHGDSLRARSRVEAAGFLAVQFDSPGKRRDRSGD